MGAALFLLGAREAGAGAVPMSPSERCAMAIVRGGGRTLTGAGSANCGCCCSWALRRGGKSGVFDMAMAGWLSGLVKVMEEGPPDR